MHFWGGAGGIFRRQKVLTEFTDSLISDHKQPIRRSSVGSQQPRHHMRCEAAMPRANEARHGEGGCTCDKVLSGAGGRRGTRSVSTLTDFYDLHLSLAVLAPRPPFPCCHSHVHWPSAPGSGPAAWSATESSSHGTFGLDLMVASLISPKSLGRSPLPSFSDRNWKGGGTGRYPRS